MNISEHKRLLMKKKKKLTVPKLLNGVSFSIHAAVLSLCILFWSHQPTFMVKETIWKKKLPEICE